MSGTILADAVLPLDPINRYGCVKKWCLSQGHEMILALNAVLLTYSPWSPPDQGKKYSEKKDTRLSPTPKTQRPNQNIMNQGIAAGLC